MSPKWKLLAFAVVAYICAHAVFSFVSLRWMPEHVIDPTLTKKNADGPLILRDDIFERPKGKNVLVGAAVLPSTKDEDSEVPSIVEPKDSKPFVLNVTEAFRKEFRRSVKTVANRTGDFVLFTMINDAYLNLTLNWLCNAYALGGSKLHKKVLIVSLGQANCVKIRKDWKDVKCIWMNADSRFAESLNWGRKAYVQILTARAELIATLAEESVPFVVFETDAVWLRNPLTLFGNSNKVDDADLVLPLNGRPANGETLAFDPMVVFATAESKRALREMVTRLHADDSLMDQTVLNALCSSQFHGLVCRHFEWSEVADGKWFKLSENERKELRPYVVNNNYYVGVRNKMARQALNGLWFLSPKLVCNISKAKKLIEKSNKRIKN